MKMIYLSNSRLPTERAHGVQIVKMCEAFAGREVTVELVAPRRLNKIKIDPFEYYQVKRNFKITKLPCLDLVSIPFGAIGFFIQLFSFLLSAKLYLLSKRYDILYTRDQFAGLFFKNFIFEVHSLPVKAGWLHKVIWRKAKFLIVLTSFIKKDLVGFGVPASKIMVAADSVDLKEFNFGLSQSAAREKFGLPLDKKLVGYVGMLRTLGMEKGITEAIKAVARLSADVALVLVGGFEEDVKFYKKMAVDLGVAERVLFTGKVPRTQVPVYLRAFDTLIAPFPDIQHYRFYMSPLKMFEYMASGKPIVISDLPSVREVLSPASAFFCRPGDIETLAEAIKESLYNRGEAERRVIEASKLIGQYTWSNRAKNILEFVKI